MYMIAAMGKKHNQLSDQIRRAVDASGMSRYAICKAVGINQAALSRFMSGKVGLQLSTLDALADMLKLELIPLQKKKGDRIIKRPRYSATTGGHAPGHLRNAFLECLENWAKGQKTPERERLTFRELTGKLWNCTDIMPGSECDLLDIPTGSTFAQAARNVRLSLDE